MTTETHVSAFMEPGDVNYYPQDGAFVSGLYIEGARYESSPSDADISTGSHEGESYSDIPPMSLKPPCACVVALLYVLFRIETEVGIFSHCP